MKIKSWTVDVFKGEWYDTVFDEDGNAYSKGLSKICPVGKSLNWCCHNYDKLKLGKCSIGAFTMMNAKYGIEIGDYVQLGSHCDVFSVSTHWKGDKGKVVIKKNARIGNHCFIMPDVTIGENAIVGAFSFININIPDNCIAYGVPVRVIRNLSKDEIAEMEDIKKERGVKLHPKYGVEKR